MNNQVSDAAALGIGLVALLVMLLVALGVIVLMVFVWGTIFRKAGYSFAMAFLMLIPVVNLVWLLIFAFSKWPIQEQLEQYAAAYHPPYAQGQPLPPPPPQYR